MKKILIMLFLTSCTTANFEGNKKKVQLDFNYNLTFEKFRLLLDEYALNNDFPDINK